MADAPLITDEARALIGQELSVISYEISREDIKKLSIAIGDLNPLYMDEEAAMKTRHGGIIGHPLQCFATVYGLVPESDLGPEGRPNFRRLPIDSTEILFGGAEIEFIMPVRPGDVITATRKITEMNDKQSTKKGWIAPVTFETTYTNQKGEIVSIARETTIYW